MSAVLVTGGTGAIGSWVLRRLIEEHGEHVVAFDTRDDRTLLSDLDGRFEVVLGDVRQLPDLIRAIKRYEVDRIIHLAAFLPPTERDNPVTAFEVNANGTQAVLEAALACDVQRIVYTSSKGVFGSFTGVYGAPEYRPVTEDLPKNPVGMYDLTKLASEHLLDFYQRAYGLEYVVLRFPVLYGPGRLARHGLVALVSRMVENALAGVPTRMPRIWADELLYTPDVAQGIVRALHAAPHELRTFHVGRNEISTMDDVAAAVRNAIPGADIELEDGVLRAEPRACRFDYSRAKVILGYEPEYDLAGGITHYAGFMRRMGIAPTVT